MRDDLKNSSETNTDTKIDRLIDKYDLEGMSAEIEERWTRENGDSTREIANFFNKRLLKEQLKHAEIQPLESELDTLYRFVAGEQMDTAEKIEVEERLTRTDVNIEELADDFISHQTIYNYLTEERGVEYTKSQTPEQRLRKSNESIQKVQGRLTAMTDSIIDSLVNVDILKLGEYDVISQVYIYCQNCETRFEISELFEQKSCECDAPDEVLQD